MRFDQPRGFRKSMSWVHTWGGLLAGWLLFAIFVTGTLSFFRQEITVWMQPELHSAQPDSQGLARALHYLEETAPDARRWTIEQPNPRSPVLSLGASNSERERRGGQTVMDPATGDILKPRQTAGGRFFVTFHYQLHGMGPTIGRWIVGIVTMAMFVALITGVIIHRNVFKDFFTFRPGKGKRSWLDAHNATGILALPFYLVITFSGLLLLGAMLLPSINWAAYSGDPRGLHAEIRGQAPGGQRPGAERGMGRDGAPEAAPHAAGAAQAGVPARSARAAKPVTEESGQGGTRSEAGERLPRQVEGEQALRSEQLAAPGEGNPPAFERRRASGAEGWRRPDGGEGGEGERRRARREAAQADVGESYEAGPRAERRRGSGVAWASREGAERTRSKTAQAGAEESDEASLRAERRRGSGASAWVDREGSERASTAVRSRPRVAEDREGADTNSAEGRRAWRGSMEGRASAAAERGAQRPRSETGEARSQNLSRNEPAAALATGAAVEAIGLERVPLTDLEPLLAKARESWPVNGVQGITITNPGKADAVIEIREAGAERLSNRGQSERLRFNGVTGEALEVAGNPYSVVRSIFATFQALHLGNFALPFARWLLFASGLLGCVVIASGLVIWVISRQKDVDALGRKPLGHRLVEVLNVPAVAGVLVALAAYFWANRLIPATLEGRSDWEIRSFLIVWGLMLVHSALRSHKRAWVEQLSLAGALSLLLPLLNALTGGIPLYKSFGLGQWQVASFDLCALIMGVVLIWTAQKVWTHVPRARANKKEDEE